MSALEVIRPGPLALLQDAGRPGLAALGITGSGAFDRKAFRAGAALVGNDPAGRDAAIEITLGGLVVRASGGPVQVALTGAPVPATVGGLAAPFGRAFALAEGDELALELPPRGVRSYLSVRGGLLAEPEFGSRSRDLLAQLGPPPLKAGDVMAVGLAPAWQPAADGTLEPDFPAVLEVLPGPRPDWLAEPAALARTWEVSPQSDRVGVRLLGEALAWAAARIGTELPSEPVVRGGVQVPPGGLPVLFGPDHPTTGGYPVVGVIADSDRLAQLRPGDPITLRWVR
ncbi:MAG: biotin-dependent carboxyltransferase family protein [Actinobacteria bacterium]|nr:biotin-dependent carboxyltransferase family protein [Actinomycetota bacterium]